MAVYATTAVPVVTMVVPYAVVHSVIQSMSDSNYSGITLVELLGGRSYSVEGVVLEPTALQVCMSGGGSPTSCTGTRAAVSYVQQRIPLSSV